MGANQSNEEAAPVQQSHVNVALDGKPESKLKAVDFDDYVSQFYSVAKIENETRDNQFASMEIPPTGYNTNEYDRWKENSSTLKFISWSDLVAKQVPGVSDENFPFYPMTYKDSTSNEWIYFGEYLNGKRHGRGRLIERETASLYDGYWEFHNMVYGRIIHSDGDYYEGQVKFSHETDARPLVARPHGKGKEFSLKHGSYTGMYVKGKKYGKGEFKFSGISKDTYTGDFVNGSMEGQGTFVWEHGNRFYSGQWRNGQMHGRGKYYWGYNTSNPPRSDSIYDGDYLNGKKHGKGELRQGETWKYKGQWKDGVQDGECEYFIDDKEVLHVNCRFVNGKLEGKCFIYKKGIKDKFEVEFKAGELMSNNSTDKPEQSNDKPMIKLIK